MTKLRNYIVEACERLDASIFNGDVLYNNGEREALKEYILRWSRAIKQHEAIMDIDSGI